MKENGFLLHVWGEVIAHLAVQYFISHLKIFYRKTERDIFIHFGVIQCTSQIFLHEMEHFLICSTVCCYSTKLQHISRYAVYLSSFERAIGLQISAVSFLVVFHADVREVGSTKHFVLEAADAHWELIINITAVWKNALHNHIWYNKYISIILREVAKWSLRRKQKQHFLFIHLFKSISLITCIIMSHYYPNNY